MTTKAITTPCPGCGLAVERELPEANTPLSKTLREFGKTIVLWHNSCLEEANADHERVEREERIRQLAASSGLASPLASAVKHASWPEPLGALITSWAQDRERHIVLTGPYGVGKSWLAAAGAHRRLMLAKPVRWVSAPALLARLGMGFGTREHDEAVTILTRTVALVIDDLDKVRPTEYGAEQVFLAIDGRLAASRPLLVTTNLAPSEMAKHWPGPYGEAIASRLGGQCRVVQMTGRDRRLEQ